MPRELLGLSLQVKGEIKAMQDSIRRKHKTRPKKSKKKNLLNYVRDHSFLRNIGTRKYDKPLKTEAMQRVVDRVKGVGEEGTLNINGKQHLDIGVKREAKCVSDDFPINEVDTFCRVKDLTKKNLKKFNELFVKESSISDSSLKETKTEEGTSFFQILQKRKMNILLKAKNDSQKDSNWSVAVEKKSVHAMNTVLNENSFENNLTDNYDEMETDDDVTLDEIPGIIATHEDNTVNVIYSKEYRNEVRLLRQKSSVIRKRPITLYGYKKYELPHRRMCWIQDVHEFSKQMLGRKLSSEKVNTVQSHKRMEIADKENLCGKEELILEGKRELTLQINTVESDKRIEIADQENLCRKEELILEGKKLIEKFGMDYLRTWALTLLIGNLERNQISTCLAFSARFKNNNNKISEGRIIRVEESASNVKPKMSNKSHIIKEPRVILRPTKRNKSNIDEQIKNTDSTGIPIIDGIEDSPKQMEEARGKSVRRNKQNIVKIKNVILKKYRKINCRSNIFWFVGSKNDNSEVTVHFDEVNSTKNKFPTVGNDCHRTMGNDALGSGNSVFWFGHSSHDCRQQGTQQNMVVFRNKRRCNKTSVNKKYRNQICDQKRLVTNKCKWIESVGRIHQGSLQAQKVNFKIKNHKDAMECSNVQSLGRKEFNKTNHEMKKQEIAGAMDVEYDDMPCECDEMKAAFVEDNRLFVTDKLVHIELNKTLIGEEMSVVNLENLTLVSTNQRLKDSIVQPKDKNNINKPAENILSFSSCINSETNDTTREQDTLTLQNNKMYKKEEGKLNDVVSDEYCSPVKDNNMYKNEDGKLNDVVSDVYCSPVENNMYKNEEGKLNDVVFDVYCSPVEDNNMYKNEEGKLNDVVSDEYCSPIEDNNMYKNEEGELNDVVSDVYCSPVEDNNMYKNEEGKLNDVVSDEYCSPIELLVSLEDIRKK